MRVGEPTGGTGAPPIGWLWMGAAALLALLFYREFVLAPELLLFGTDMLGEGFPLRRFLVEELRAGRGVPGWTPHVFGGMPYVALLPGPVFYPTTLLYLLMPLHRAIGWTFVLHTFLGGAFGYFCGRSFRLGRAASAVCGASFMFTGYVMSHLYGGQDGRMFAMVLMPLALGALERGLRSGEIRWFVCVGVAVALQIFTPHTQLMYFSSLALALHLVFHLVARVNREGPPGRPEVAGERGERMAAPRAYLRPVGLFTGAFLLAAGLGAAQLFPTLALLEHVVRAAPESGYEFAASWALQPQEITALFLPDLIGSLPGTYWGANPFKLHTEYLGAAPLALAVLAVAASFGSGVSREARRMIWYLAIAAGLGVLFALGAATPVHRVAYAIVPMIDGLRAPAMMMGPVALFVSLLAGFGWDRAIRHREEVVDAGSSGTTVTLAPRVWLALLATPFLFLGAAALVDPSGLQQFVYHAWYPAGWPRTPIPALEGPLRVGGAILLGGWTVALGAAWAVSASRLGRVAVVAVLAVIVFDLWRVDSRYLRTADAAVLEPDAAMLALLERVRPGERVWALPGSYRPNDFMYFGISSATGSQKFLLRWYERLVGRLPADQGERLSGYPNTLWPLLDLRYLTAASEIESPLLEPIAAPGPAQPGQIRLHAARSTQPHAFFPARIEAVGDEEEALRRTLANGTPAELAIVEPAGEGEVPPAAGSGTATIVAHEPDEIVLRARAEQAGLLAISEIYHPAWRAYVDGRETTVWRTNVAFRGVEVPEGEHEIRFTYRSAALRVGIVVSLVSSLVALLLVAPWSRFRGAAGPGDA